MFVNKKGGKLLLFTSFFIIYCSLLHTFRSHFFIDFLNQSLKNSTRALWIYQRFGGGRCSGGDYKYKIGRHEKDGYGIKYYLCPHPYLLYLKV